MPERRAPFCAEVSLENGESLAATASRVDHWILVEYRGLWGHDALAASGLSNGGEGTAARAARRAAEHEAPLPPPPAPARPSESGGVLGQLGAVRRAALPRRDRGVRRAARPRPDRSRAASWLGHPLLIVCTHGKHDRCCARHGRPLYKALEEQAEDGWVWQSSHVGGDRFAGNVVVLPEGLYFGRVEPGAAWSLLDEYLAGRIDLDHYRGRSVLHLLGAGGGDRDPADDRAPGDRRPRAGRARGRARAVPRRLTHVRRRCRLRAG